MWYIGQKIVAIKDHSQGMFKKGDTFVIKGLRNCICKCEIVEIDINIRDNSNMWECPVCKMDGIEYTDIYWFHEDMFKPLEEATDENELEKIDISELTKILEKELV